MISVCMATYNGEKYVLEQISSIISQLDENDELIIVDDCSRDNTVTIIESIQDERIKLVVNSVNLGVNKSFERAISMSKNEYIFMCDQDDIWVENRKKIMLDALQMEDVLLVSGNSQYIDSVGNNIERSKSIGLKKEDSTKNIKNIIDIFIGKADYYGCTMGMQRDILQYAMPFPEYIESHDLWIAMLANVLKRNLHLDAIVLKRRIHGNNASVIERSWIEKICSRWIFIKSLIEINKRIKFLNN